LAGQRVRHAGQLEHHAPGLDHGDPALGRALARAHAGLGRLLREGLVGIDVDPDLAAALHLAGHRDTRGLDLAVGQPALVERLEAVLAEPDAGLPAAETVPAPAVLLAVLDALGRQHLAATSSRPAAAAPAAARAAGTAAPAAASAAPAAAPGPARAAGPAAAPAAPAPVAAAAPAALAVVASARRRRRLHLGQVGAGVALGHDLALVHPALHADAAERRARLVEAVVDVRAQRVQRDATVRVALGARHLGAAEPPADLELAALGARAHRAGQRALHRAAERD